MEKVPAFTELTADMISCTPMVQQMEDYLIMVTNSLAIAGKIFLMAWGRTM